MLARTGPAIGRGRNPREAGGDPTAHAEIVALREAAASARGSWRLDDCTLVVTLEPCTMCAGAMLAGRVSAAWSMAPVTRGPAPPARCGTCCTIRGSARRSRFSPGCWPQTAPRCSAGFSTSAASRLAIRRRPAQVGSAAVESPSGRGRTPRKRVKGQPFRGFKSHLHRHCDVSGHRSQVCQTSSSLRVPSRARSALSRTASRRSAFR